MALEVDPHRIKRLPQRISMSPQCGSVGRISQAQPTTFPKMMEP